MRSTISIALFLIVGVAVINANNYGSSGAVSYASAYPGYGSSLGYSSGYGSGVAYSAGTGYGKQSSVNKAIYYPVPVPVRTPAPVLPPIDAGLDGGLGLGFGAGLIDDQNDGLFGNGGIFGNSGAGILLLFLLLPLLLSNNTILG